MRTVTRAIVTAFLCCVSGCATVSMKNAQTDEGRAWHSGGELRILGIPIPISRPDECQGLERARFSSIGVDPILAYRIIQTQCVGE